jgi:hypothetical protein
MQLEQKDIAILQESENRLRQLSPERLRVAADFLAYLQEREENQVTEELLNIPQKRLRITPSSKGSGYSDTSINYY